MSKGTLAFRFYGSFLLAIVASEAIYSEEILEFLREGVMAVAIAATLGWHCEAREHSFLAGERVWRGRGGVGEGGHGDGRAAFTRAATRLPTSQRLIK